MSRIGKSTETEQIGGCQGRAGVGGGRGGAGLSREGHRVFFWDDDRAWTPESGGCTTRTAPDARPCDSHPRPSKARPIRHFTPFMRHMGQEAGSGDSVLQVARSRPGHNTCSHSHLPRARCSLGSPRRSRGGWGRRSARAGGGSRPNTALRRGDFPYAHLRSTGAHPL